MRLLFGAFIVLLFIQLRSGSFGLRFAAVLRCASHFPFASGSPSFIVMLFGICQESAYRHIIQTDFSDSLRGVIQLKNTNNGMATGYFTLQEDPL
jgi:hypothetical protein